MRIQNGLACLWLASVVVVLSLAQQAGADDGVSETAKKFMPKDQQEVVSQLQQFEQQRAEARNLKNALARQEASDKIEKDENKWQTALNHKAVEGLKDWIGKAKIGRDKLTLQCANNLRIEISVNGMSDQVKQTIAKLQDGDLVKFTITLDRDSPLGFLEGWTPKIVFFDDGKALRAVSKQ